jgi:hypothetical protein
LLQFRAHVVSFRSSENIQLLFRPDVLNLANEQNISNRSGISSSFTPFLVFYYEKAAVFNL